MKVPTKDYRKQYEAILPELLDDIRESLLSDDPILGEPVVRFEARFADYLGAKYAVGVGSGTDALWLALMSLGIGRGDEVITAANTFVGTVTAIALSGATPILVDPDPTTMNVTSERLGSAITERTRALLPVHLYGRICPCGDIRDLARRHRLWVIEDVAQAHGARDSDGRRAGTLGDIGCFSFHPSKNLGAFGDGGAVVTDDAARAESLRRLRHLGKVTKYDVSAVAPNSKLDTLQAVILARKLDRLERDNARRCALALMYLEGLRGVGDLVLPDYPSGGQHVYHLFVVKSERREALREFLQSRGIKTGMQYPRPPHLQNMGIPWSYREGSFPIAEHCARTVVSLPISPELADEQIVSVIRQVRAFYGESS